jgi:IMP cyclohydrolase
VRTFPRYQKYTVGTDLREGARRVLTLVVRANSRRDKAPTLLAVREEVEALKAVLRLAHDVQAFQTLRSFEHAVVLAVEVAKQNEGWLKHQQARAGRQVGRDPSRRAMPQGPATPGAS